MIGIDYTSPSGDELCGGHHFDVMPLGDSNVTVFFVRTSDGNELSRAGVQNLGVGTDVQGPLSIKSHDMMDTTNVPVPMVFDHFRNTRFKNFRSDYMWKPGNFQRANDHHIQTGPVGNAAPVIHHISVSRVNEGASSLEESSYSREICTHGVVGYVGSSSTIAPVNRAYLCLNVTDGVVRPKIIPFTNNRMGSTYEGDGRIENTHDTGGLFQHSEVFVATPVSDTSSVGACSMRRPSIQVFVATPVSDTSSVGACSMRRPSIQGRTPSYIDLDPGLYLKLLLKPKNGTGMGQKVIMNTYYKYGLHPRVKGFGLIFRGGRLFQQYVVAAFCAIEQSHLDFIRKQQSDIRFDYLLGITPSDRADIMCRIFEQKVNDSIRFLKDKRPFGYVIAFLYTIEFQKQGLPHCHTLLSVDSSNKIKDATQIDDYISAELPDPVEDPIGYKVVTELIMYGPVLAQKGDMNKEVHWKTHLRSPDSGDLFYFRMLLSHQKGCKSLVEVRTVNGQVLPTYQATCEALGLLGDDKEWDIALEEAMQDDIPGTVSKATAILDYHLNTPELKGYILYELEAILNGFEKSVKEFGIPTPPEHLLKDLKNRLLMEEKNYRCDILLQEKNVFWKTIISSLRSQGKIVLAVASSGITSLLLTARRTTHSRFKLPLKLTDESVWHAKNTADFKVYTLKENMRLLRSDLSDEERERSKFFAKWLLDVENSEISDPDKDNDAVNAKILSSVEGVVKTYRSRDEAIQMGRETNETKMLYPIEYLNAITFTGFPPHELQLKTIILSSYHTTSWPQESLTKMKKTRRWYTNADSDITPSGDANTAELPEKSRH
uniref:ATP-dependent DNA helicase n=1 Tax=Tanacetum cinerariifolium TaxID=118510 RepID=A0A6L2N6U0_TANCI|nr:DNA helicase [Tanacetum cinerariifolium]